MNSNELYQFHVTLSSFSNWPVFSAFFFLVARADRGGSSSFSYSLHSTNTYGPNTFQKIQVKTVLSGRAPLRQNRKYYLAGGAGGRFLFLNF